MVDRNGIKRTSIRRSNINAIQKNNFHAAKIIGNMIRTSFGPKGLDKMTINSLGDIFIVNDGKTILEKVDYKHPIAKTLLDITKTVTSSIGDGSISAVLLSMIVGVVSGMIPSYRAANLDPIDSLRYE